MNRRIDQEKTMRTLLAAFAALGDEFDVGLTIIGAGPLEQELRGLAQELGVADRVDIRAYDPDPARLMRLADAFVLSSRWEGFPNVLLEAICEGCPVVSTRSSDAVAELVDSDEVGLVTPVEDAGALAEALRTLLRRERPVPAHRSHPERYHLGRIADLYAAVIALPAQD
jgi:glycosyltransferase involved in cell wall biosynthesis